MSSPLFHSCCAVQIHNWATDLECNSSVPSLEFVAPTRVFVVMDAVKHHIDLERVPVCSLLVWVDRAMHASAWVELGPLMCRIIGVCVRGGGQAGTSKSERAD